MKIVLPVALALLLSACSQEDKSSIQKVDTVTEVPTKKIEKEVPKQVEVKPEVNEIEKVIIQETKTVSATKTGKDIYIACSACHGQNAEKVALGKSKVIKGWDSAKTVDALNGYKNGTYGGAMKGLMKGQVSNLSDEDIKKVADYISKF